MTISAEQKKLHHEIKYVGLRAQATAAGLVQLCKELKAVGVLKDDALERVKGAITDEIVLAGPRQATRADYRVEVAKRLDRIFAGEQTLGEAEVLSFDPDTPPA